MSAVQPVLFLAHGAPTSAVEEDGWSQALRAWGNQHLETLRPRALLVISAHWRARGTQGITGEASPETVHDFSGFPEALYRLRYPCPGAPALSRDIASRLKWHGWTVAQVEHRGLDHGVWVPLMHLRPAADIPVLQLSLPVESPSRLVELGIGLRTLREEGVLIIGSGGIVHNLGMLHFEDRSWPVDPWAEQFEQAVAQHVHTHALDMLTHYRERLPGAGLSVPTTEHFDPLLVALGAVQPDERCTDLFTGFHYGNLSMRCFAWETPSP